MSFSGIKMLLYHLISCYAFEDSGKPGSFWIFVVLETCSVWLGGRVRESQGQKCSGRWAPHFLPTSGRTRQQQESVVFHLTHSCESFSNARVFAFCEKCTIVSSQWC